MLVIDPNDVDALNNKVLALSNLGKFNESIEYYDKALAISPNDVYALNNKGFTLYNLGQYEEAIRYYDKILAIDPNNTLASGNKRLAIDNLRPPFFDWWKDKPLYHVVTCYLTR